MGCFMACFGLSNKRKRRKTLYKVLAPHQKYGNYEVLAITERSIIQDSELRGRDEVKEKNSVKSKKKKKVTFNLNVQVYELNPTAYQVLNNEEEENKNNSAELEGSAALPVRYPTNHRYYNCGDGYDEGDEIEYEDEYDEDDEFDDDDDDEYDWDDDDDKIKNQMPLDSSNAELKSNLSGRDRSIMHSVLIPVENLTQWKAIKTKVPSSSKHRRKENVPLESNALQSKPLLPETAVDASLSNWLISPNYPLSSTTIHCQ
uniref:Uncharacterized protein n=1 Tax=Cajanus cajan TaxID=3821 RepID=A0A151T145_CAJCA|nr:hypothetical protein KK1_023187 [Cajanus cajan]